MNSISTKLIKKIENKISGEIKCDIGTRILFSTDASIYQMLPLGVVFPRNIDDISNVINIAKLEGISVVPRGGGTSLAGQTVNNGLVIDMSKFMNKLINVIPEEKIAEVEHVIVIDDFNNLIKKNGLFFTPDPSTSNRACVGGAIGNNSCGSHSILFGKTSDHIIELNTVLSDGSQYRTSRDNFNNKENQLSINIEKDLKAIVKNNQHLIEKRFPKIMRRVSGYNLDLLLDKSDDMSLSNLLVGSEGTLAIIGSAKVNLESLPKYKGMAILQFETVTQASEASQFVVEERPSAIELIDRNILIQCKLAPGYSSRLNFVTGEPGALLIVEFFGETKNDILNKLQQFKYRIEKKRISSSVLIIDDELEQMNVWEVRKAGLGLLMAVKGDRKPIPFVEDTAVPVERLGEFVSEFNEIVNSHGTTAGYFGPASVGCLHIRPMIDIHKNTDLKKMEKISAEIVDLVLKYGGAVSGEHGDGIVRGVWNKKIFGEDIYNAFLSIKKSFDPDNLFNPGKIIETPGLTKNLRWDTKKSIFFTDTSFDYSDHGSFGKAVAMCNGMGVCRKSNGSMCPSYQITRDEEHSTRGRANLLRAMTSGKIDIDKVVIDRVKDSLDLCIECKACKNECATGVDMTRFKMEFLDRFENKFNIRNLIFSEIHNLNKFGSYFPFLMNFFLQSKVVKFLLRYFLSISDKRSLPKLADTTFKQWFHSRKLTNINSQSETVVLLVDTFMNYNHPEIGKATVKLLEKMGYKILLSNIECCGRPLFSKGKLNKAKHLARANILNLKSYIDSNYPIIGCEPSCILSYRDEYPDIVGQDLKNYALEVSTKVKLIDEFILETINLSKHANLFKELDKNILFHVHCHQKALMGTKKSVDALSIPSGYKVQLIDGGCCGMAGSFGYEKEHYDISKSIFSQNINNQMQNNDFEVAVTGMSCRHQIEHFTGKKAKHLIELLAEAL